MITPLDAYKEYQEIPVHTASGRYHATVKRYRNAGIPTTLGPNWRAIADDMERYFRRSAHRDDGVANARPDLRTFTHGNHQVAFAPAGNTRIALAFRGKLTPTDLKYFFQAFVAFWPHRQPGPLWSHLGTTAEPPFQALADQYLGADCNSFVASYVLRRAPALYHGTERSIDAYRDRRALRSTLQQIRPGDIMIWGRNTTGNNIHIAAIDSVFVTGATATLAIAQAASDSDVRGLDYRRGFTLELNAAGNIALPIPNLFHLRRGAMGGAYVDVYGVDR